MIGSKKEISMKKEFQEAEIEVILLDAADVVTNSGDIDGELDPLTIDQM